MNKIPVTTWQTPDGQKVKVSESQQKMMEEAKVWLRDCTGQEFCSVYRGYHRDYPTFSNEDILMMMKEGVSIRLYLFSVAVW